MTTSNNIDIDKNINIHLESKNVSRYFFWFIWLMYAFVTMTKNCYNSSMADIVSEGLLTKSQTGFITAMFYLVYTPLQIVGGMVADKYSPERVIKIGLIGAGIVNTIIFFNQNYYVMLASWIFNAAIQFGIWPSTFKIVSSQLVRSDRKSMAFYLSFSATGGLLFSYLVAAFVPKWQYNFAVSAIVLFVFAVLLHIYEKHLNPYMKWDKISENNEEVSEASLTLGQVFSKYGFYYVLLVTFLSIIVSQARSSLTPVMLVESYGNISPSLGNLLNIFLIISGIVGTLVAGKIAKKIFNVTKAWSLALILCVPFFAVVYFVGKLSVGLIIISLCIVSGFDSFAALMRTNYTMLYAKSGKSGTAAGILNSGMALSYVTVAYGVTKFVELTNWQIYAAVMIVLLILSSFILIIPTIKQSKQKKDLL